MKHFDYLKLGLVFFVIGLAANPIHEFGHWIFYELYGVKAGFSFNHTYFKSEWQEVIMGAMGGPLISLLLALIGLLILYKVPSLSYLGAGLAVIMSFTRLLPYMKTIGKGSIVWNDEGVTAIYLNWPLWSIFIIMLTVFLVILILVWRGLKDNGKRKTIIFTLAFCSYIFAVGLEIGVFENIFFEDVGMKELVMPRGVFK